MISYANLKSLINLYIAIDIFSRHQISNTPKLLHLMRHESMFKLAQISISVIQPITDYIYYQLGILADGDQTICGEMHRHDPAFGKLMRTS